MSSASVTQRPITAIAAAVPGGLGIAVLGAIAALAPAATDGVWWFLTAAVAALLLTVAILALRARVTGVARPALAHVYTLVDADTAILLFSVFLVVLALGMIVAGIALARVWRGPARFVPLLCGVWPLATIPAGAAIGDLPHFGAIAVWGLCWVAFGALVRPR